MVGEMLDTDNVTVLSDTPENMKVLANGKVMKVQKTRQRKILSCVFCHSKKIKCSRAHPICNNCDKLGLECKYFINERVSRGGKKSSKLESEMEPLPDKRGSVSSSISDSNQSPISPKIKQESSSSSDELPDLLSSNNVSKLPKNDENNLPMLSDLSYIGLNGAKISGTTSYDQNNDKTTASTPNFNPSLLQTPVMNSVSNNMTNNYFNTNYTNKKPNTTAAPPDDQYSFNLSSFTFNTGDNMLNLNSVNLPTANIVPKSQNNSSTNINSLFARTSYLQPQVTNFLDSLGHNNPTNSSPASPNPTSLPQNPNNPGLNNSLNAYSSNPATTVNYLYGTNTYYDNDNLLSDLVNHLPSKARSYELLDRYVNSVHILLPIMVGLNDFIKEHDNYWENYDPTKPGSSSERSSQDFNYLQFYTLYFPILYASTISEFEEYDNLLLNQDINKYLKAFNKICQYYNYPHGLKTIPLLLGNVMIQSTSPNPSTMEMSQIIRYAKFLQMHKDPQISLRITDWEVVKFRRLLWWVIFGLDGLTSHNFCLPPVCKFEDFNVLMPEDTDPVYNESGVLVEKKLDIHMLSMNVKFKYDRILSELVYHLHNGLANNITSEEINKIKHMIVELFHFIHESILKMTQFCKANPPSTVQEMNLINFIRNHSWSFVDRALMLLHKKILLRDSSKDRDSNNDLSSSLVQTSKVASELMSNKKRNGVLSLCQFEDTFGHVQEANIITNFDNSSISQLRFNQYENFTYENLHNNLIPSILHNLNDFLKYNDFIKFGKYNWYVKRTIPLDSIILLFVIICVKFKYEFMTINEMIIYVKLINKALFILNRKWFKNEKYKRMLSLTNLTWEYILKKYDVVKLVNQYNAINNKNGSGAKLEYFDYQVTGYLNMSELFNVMDVPQPALVKDGVNFGTIKHEDSSHISSIDKYSGGGLLDTDLNTMDLNGSLDQSIFSSQLLQDNNAESSEMDVATQKTELSHLNEKIYYDLRNNFVDINDYCAFYSSLENILHELMEYINQSHVESNPGFNARLKA